MTTQTFDKAVKAFVLAYRMGKYDGHFDSAWDEWLEENLDKFPTDDDQIAFRDWESVQSKPLRPKDCTDVDEIDMLWSEYSRRNDGGPGSGNFGHEGREGKVGGSAKGNNSNTSMSPAAAIASYQDYGYQTVNNALRNGEKLTGEAKAIDTGMQKAFSTSKPLKLQRRFMRDSGMALTAEAFEKTGLSEALKDFKGDLRDAWYDPDIRQKINDSLVGYEFKEKGYASTTSSYEFLQQYTAGQGSPNYISQYGCKETLAVTVPKGTKVLDLGDSGFIPGSGENETILNKNGTFKVTAVGYDAGTASLLLVCDYIPDQNEDCKSLGSRYDDGEPASWITLENGEHVPLDKNGRAIGGAGGWAVGKDFSKAKGGNGKKPGVSDSLNKNVRESYGKGDYINTIEEIRQSITKLPIGGTITTNGKTYEKTGDDEYTSEWDPKYHPGEYITYNENHVVNSCNPHEVDKAPTFTDGGSKPSEPQKKKELTSGSESPTDKELPESTEASDKDKGKELFKKFVEGGSAEVHKALGVNMIAGGEYEPNEVDEEAAKAIDAVFTPAKGVKPLYKGMPMTKEQVEAIKNGNAFVNHTLSSASSNNTVAIDYAENAYDIDGMIPVVMKIKVEDGTPVADVQDILGTSGMKGYEKETTVGRNTEWEYGKVKNVGDEDDPFYEVEVTVRPTQKKRKDDSSFRIRGKRHLFYDTCRLASLFESSGNAYFLNKFLDFVKPSVTVKVRESESSRADKGEWVTINGTHVLIDDESGEMVGGPANLKASADKGKGKKAVQRKAIRAADTKCQNVRKKLESAEQAKKEWDRLEWKARNSLDDAKRNADYRKRQLDEAQKEVDKYPSGRSKEEISKDIENLNEEIDRMSDWIDSHPRKEGESRDDRRARREMKSKLSDATDELIKASNEKFAVANLEKAKKEYDKAAAKQKEMEEVFDDISKADPSKSIQQLRDEYDQHAKARNEAVLKAYPTADDCDTPQAATDYLRAREYFDQSNGYLESDRNTDLTKMSPERASAQIKQLDRFFGDYPGLKGKFQGIDCHDFSNEAGYENSYGYANGTQISLNEAYYGPNGDVESSFEKDTQDTRWSISGFHPSGTNASAIIDHEYTHAIESLLNAHLGVDHAADLVMKKAQEIVDGEYLPENDEFVRAQVSGYAFDNKGIRHDPATGDIIETDPGYGLNTEWLAEAIADARNNSAPNEYSVAARKALEELMKEAGLK